ncbi:MAG: hypothetical protein ACRELY_27805 [Polyangiaceae bacterium]
MASSSARYGVPGILALARTRYEARRAELLRSSAHASEIDARILDEARADGGTRAAGEHINLSLWSERFAIPRPVLEAIVLSIHRHEPRTPPPPVIVMPPEEDDETITPPPAALRHPVVAIPPSAGSVR